MDRISNAAQHALMQPMEAVSDNKSGIIKRIGKVAASGIPWAIICLLFWAGVFIKPQPVGGTVQPPVIERRDHFFGLAAAPAGGIWVAGSNGKIVSIGSDGNVERMITPTDQTLQDIAVWNDRHAVAVGNDGVVLITADGGRNWTKVDEIPRSEIANKLNRVSVVANGIAIATGEMGALLRSNDFGATWTRLREEEDVAWNDAAILPDGRIVVVGEFGRVILSSDGGTRWQEITSPVESSLMSVAFRNNSVGVAVGLEGIVLLTRDGGASWVKVDAGSRDHLFDVTWDEFNNRWLGAGALGGWVSADAEDQQWRAGRVDERDLAWHTRVLPVGNEAWFAGANIGRWDSQRWTALGH